MDSGSWYYYNEKGEMQKGTTIKVDGKDYKFNANGVLILDEATLAKMKAANFKEVTYDSSEAYKKSHKEWKQVGNDWYYNEGDEKVEELLTNDWDRINGVWYYFNDKGVMQKNTTVKDEKGNDCVLNADGALTNRAKPEFDFSKVSATVYTQKVIDGKTYYVDAKGEKKIGWVLDNGKWYYTNKDGVMQKNTSIIEGDKKFVLGADGAWIQ